jgi:hypothetical protein
MVILLSCQPQEQQLSNPVTHLHHTDTSTTNKNTSQIKTAIAFTQKKYYLNTELELTEALKEQLYQSIKQLPESKRQALLQRSSTLLISYFHRNIALDFDKQRVLFSLHSTITSFLASHLGYEQGIATLITACELNELEQESDDYFLMTILECNN